MAVTTENTTFLYTRLIHVGTTIRVSDDTKDLLERLKHEDETFDEVVARLARESDSMNPGVWDSEQADAAREVLQRSRERIGRER